MESIGRVLSVQFLARRFGPRGVHGPAVIDPLETEARRNPAFNNVLGGVWSSNIDPDVCERVEQIGNEVL